MSKVLRHDIAQAILDMLKAGESAEHVATSLASYLVAERRTRELDALMRDIESIRYREEGILEATLVSARELDEPVRENIKRLMQATKVQLHHELNPDTVGGVRIRALDKQLDLSIRTKLQHLKNVTNAA